MSVNFVKFKFLMKIKERGRYLLKKAAEALHRVIVLIKELFLD